MDNLQNKRYSEEDLAVFKNLLDKKLAKAEKQLATLDAQLDDVAANKSGESDWVDDSSNSANIQLLDTMAHRLRKHIVDLKKALLRIHNKSYGICMITKELIDKKRLMAVPTTTKSVAAKTGKSKEVIKKKSAFTNNETAKKTRIISRVVPKIAPNDKVAQTSDIKDRWAQTDQLLSEVEPLDLNEELED